MAEKHTDPTEPIRVKASGYPGVAEGTSCTQSSFKTGKKSFLFIGAQGSRFKAMVKLQRFMPEALRLAGKYPDCYEVGSTGWVTARFTAEKPMPRKLWERWLDESYQLSLAAGPDRKAEKKKVPKKKTTGKPVAKKAKPKAKQK